MVTVAEIWHVLPTVPSDLRFGLSDKVTSMRKPTWNQVKELVKEARTGEKLEQVR
jgi:hypothetical protein